MNKPLTQSFEAQYINGVLHIIIPNNEWKSEFTEHAIILTQKNEYMIRPYN